MEQTSVLNTTTFGSLDLHFARFVARISRDVRPEVFWAAALVSRSTGAGNICLHLPAWAGRELLAVGETSFFAPAYVDWRRVLLENSAVGQPGDSRPLIMDDEGRLYLYRYWDYEDNLARFILDRVPDRTAAVDIWGDAALIKETLQQLFPVDTDIPGPDWQKLAAAVALLRPFTVISGSPGTGKTTTATKIMALLLATAAAKRPVLALTAPSGKAAVRLQEAVKKMKQLLPAAATPVRDAIPEQATTIHRLLGTLSDSPYFRHDRKNPLPVDVVIVDEASMVDLPLMSKLVQALPPQAKLILLGDHDQLTSVEAGAVLGDICGSAPLNVFSGTLVDQLEHLTGEAWQGRRPAGIAGMADCLVQLRHNYRFSAASGIGRVSAAVREGDAPAALRFLQEGGFDDLRWSRPDKGGFLSVFRDRLITGFREYLQAAAAGDFAEAFASFERFRILCVLRRGPWGTEMLNNTIERLLRAEGLVEPSRRWYQARPVMIVRNDYTQRLFNGDVGLILPDLEAGGELRAFFRDASGAVRKFLPLRLPEHETAYALTVHKSQGSEFDKVFFILPDQDIPLLTRELVYTALTRARHFVEIWGTAGVLQAAVIRRITRTSGLRDALWRQKTR